MLAQKAIATSDTVTVSLTRGTVRWCRSATPAKELASDTSPGRRLKIGYISPDLKSHVVSKFLQGPVREHDRTQVDIRCHASLLRALPPTLSA